MRFNIDSLPFLLINKKIVRKSKLQADAERIFACLNSPEAQDCINAYSGRAKSRFLLDQFRFVRMAYWLNLPSQPQKSILDLGGRHGMWLSVCKHYGHITMCSDLASELERPEIKGMLDIFKIPHVPIKIEPFKPIGSEVGSYDLVTALRTRFHSTYPYETGTTRETHWGIDEWDFFLKDIASHITSNGQLFFLMNRLQEKERGAYIPNDLFKFFKSNGAHLKGYYLWFKNLDAFR